MFECFAKRKNPKISSIQWLLLWTVKNLIGEFENKPIYNFCLLHRPSVQSNFLKVDLTSLFHTHEKNYLFKKTNFKRVIWKKSSPTSKWLSTWIDKSQYLSCSTCLLCSFHFRTFSPWPGYTVCRQWGVSPMYCDPNFWRQKQILFLSLSNNWWTTNDNLSAVCFNYDGF